MRHFVIISGGTIDDSFADRWFEEEKPDAVIAADAGMEYLYRSHRVPDVIVGDFDSVGTEALAYFKTLPGVAIQKLIPEKDDTDTESAIRLAIRRGAHRFCKPLSYHFFGDVDAAGSCAGEHRTARNRVKGGDSHPDLRCP